MTFNEISRKLAHYNMKKNLLFCISVVFAVSMLGAYGILQFSPTITNVLIKEGATYLLSLGMFGLTILGMGVFLIYADAIYLKYKMDEIGVLLSLGLKHKTVGKMLSKEFTILFFASSLMGLMLVIPVSWLCWSILTIFLKSTETTFYVGWYGFFIVGIFIAVIWLTLILLNRWTIKKLDIIKILKTTSEIEEVRGDSFIFGLLGFISVPTGIVLFNFCESTTGFLSQISGMFLGISVAGLYLSTIQITSIGNFFKRFVSGYYYRNLLFFNLVKQKGKQYTLALFVSSILITLTIFAIGFNGAVFIDSYYQIKNEPYDYTIMTSFQQIEIDEQTIMQIAKENDVEITDFRTLDLLIVGRQHHYSDDAIEWAEQLVTNQTSFNALNTIKVEVVQGTYTPFDGTGYKSAFNTFASEYGLFYNPSTKEDFKLKQNKGIRGDDILNKYGYNNRFVILNDLDYQKLKETLNEKYKLKYYMFNGRNAENAAIFQKALLSKIVEASEGLIFDNLLTLAVKDKWVLEGKDIETKEIFIPYVGNELYAARWWSLYPFARATAISVQLEAGAIYLLLVFFIAIITLISATMIIGLKIVGTIWLDKENYKKATFLGLKKKDLGQLITKQIALIYFFPTICGFSTSVLMLNQFLSVSSVQEVGVSTLLAVLMSLLVFIVQVVIFFVLRKKILQDYFKGYLI